MYHRCLIVAIVAFAQVSCDKAPKPTPPPTSPAAAPQPTRTDNTTSPTERDPAGGAAASGSAIPIGQLPYTVAPPSELAVLISKEKSVTLTPGGRAAPGPTDPKLIITRSTKVFQESDKPAGPRAFVEELAANRYSNIRFNPVARVAAGAWQGFEIVASAKAANSDDLVTIYCAKVYDATGSFTAIGFAPAARADEFTPLFRQTAQSIAPSK